ncbi:hypothetical protein [Bacillus sp. B15-48]|uniref:hypothetical protein n=1 Tax=Bacillus sp. B15-48 TaxID=1548601 RepID=UPI00193FCB25|nr:hypothetical protein [Bacillus sp. B15-48]MBM4762847.1 hypothetical protein [Bacillus sp. B15-48]
MDWALVLLFSAAILLLIISYMKIRNTAKAEQREIDSVFVSLMEEVNKLQEQIRKLELDAEISAHEAKIIGIDSKERVILREILDLYKRGYTIEGMAEKVQLSENEIQYLLTPYMSNKQERRSLSQ